MEEERKTQRCEELVRYEGVERAKERFSEGTVYRAMRNIAGNKI